MESIGGYLLTFGPALLLLVVVTIRVVRVRKRRRDRRSGGDLSEPQ